MTGSRGMACNVLVILDQVQRQHVRDVVAVTRRSRSLTTAVLDCSSAQLQQPLACSQVDSMQICSHQSAVTYRNVTITQSITAETDTQQTYITYITINNINKFIHRGNVKYGSC